MPITIHVSSKDAYKGPDPGKVRDQLFKMQQWAQDVRQGFGLQEFAEKYFWILRKNPEKGEQRAKVETERWNDRLIPFRFNNIQKDIMKRLSKRNIFLKPRQGGYTTWMIVMRLLLPAMIDPGVGCLLISQNNSYATAHFSMLHRAYRYFGWGNPFDAPHWSNDWARELHKNLLHVRYSSRKELIFDQLDSRIVCASAEVEEVGQGLTIHHLGCTEVARWEGNPEETLANVKEAVPLSGTIDIESTANMMGNYFQKECARAENGDSEFTFHFHPWWFHEEYTLEDQPVKAEALTGIEKTLLKAHNLTLGQIAWRRVKVRSLRHNFAEKYPEDTKSCFLLQGNSYFDNEILAHLLQEIEADRKLGFDDPFKKIRIYLQPRKHRRYVIGVDPQGGIPLEDNPEDLDYASMQVLDIESGEQCAVYHARIPPEDLAEDANQLGRMYNDALVAVERTGDGHTVMYVLQVMFQYMNIYKFRDLGKRDWPTQRQGQKNSGHGQSLRLKDIEGFPTTTKTRPWILNRAAVLIRETPELIHDEETVKECLTFIRNEKGKPVAAPGNHDDHVMALAIANFVRLVILGFVDPAVLRSEKYDPDIEAAEV